MRVNFLATVRPFLLSEFSQPKLRARSAKLSLRYFSKRKNNNLRRHENED